MDWLYPVVAGWQTVVLLAYVTEQIDVPLQVCVEQAVLVQVRGVPAQMPAPLHTSE